MITTRSLTPLETEALHAVLPTFSPRDRVLILTLLKTGFRISEALQLNITDVWNDGRPRVSVSLERRQLKGGRGLRRKAVRSRTVTIGPLLTTALSAYIPSLIEADRLFLLFKE